MRMFLDAEEIRRKACAEEEERHRQEERKHEERMQYMFMSFMQQICQSRATPYTPSASHHASLNVPGSNYGPGPSTGGILYPPSSTNISTIMYHIHLLMTSNIDNDYYTCLFIRLSNQQW